MPLHLKKTMIQNFRQIKSNHMQILIVEDNRELLNMLSDILSDEDTTVIRAQTGKEAIELLVRYAVDLIITDIKLPEIEGIELIIRLRQSNIPIIAMSGMEREELVQELISSLGVVEIFQKPFGIRELNQTIASLRKSKVN